MYHIKEIYYTLQGEGHHCGRQAIFIRFSGCNLWSGREEDRHKAICQFCDTDFWGTDGELGGTYEKDELVNIISDLWPLDYLPPFLVMTGGEPLLQLDQELVDALKAANCQIAIETNGTILPPKGIDWICMSPKTGSNIVLKEGDELKLVHPQLGFVPSEFEDWSFTHFYIQPMDGPSLKEHTVLCKKFVVEHPTWRLSEQMHKQWGIK